MKRHDVLTLDPPGADAMVLRTVSKSHIRYKLLFQAVKCNAVINAAFN